MLSSCDNFNPIIVLFLTITVSKTGYNDYTFQSYYSLISNEVILFKYYSILCNFNPIIVLFLTMILSRKNYFHLYFNPIIVLFLTADLKTAKTWTDANFNPIIVLFLTFYLIIAFFKFFTFQSYYSLISN